MSLSFPKAEAAKESSEEGEKKVLKRFGSERKKGTVAKPRWLHRLASRDLRVPVPMGKHTEQRPRACSDVWLVNAVNGPNRVGDSTGEGCILRKVVRGGLADK